MSNQIPHFINGQLLKTEGRKLDIFNPAKGQITSHINVAHKETVENAIQTAKRAFSTWSTTTANQRATILFRFKFLLDQHIKELSQLVTQEHGKTLKEAMGSVQRGIDVVNFTCGIANLLKGDFAEEVSSGVDCYSLHQPLGVCVGITPFNFPAMIPLWMFPMAIACGNTFILKPSEKDPSCAIRLAELAKEAGVPDGVINVLQGDKETVEVLIKHADVKAVSFVGSSVVGEQVYQTAIAHNKRVQAFGSAKNHCIIMPDADMDEAAKAIAEAAYGSAGERCMAISVGIAIGDQVADTLISKLKRHLENLKIGAGTEPNIDMGPLITHQHWERVKNYIRIGQEEGAKLVIDGSDYKPTDAVNGFFMGASLFDHVKPSMRIYREEIFGPVLSIVRVQDVETAIQLINEHEYGNGTAIFTRDGYSARTFAEKVEVGMVGINVPVPVPVAYHSFGGWKRSIFSDIGMYGTEAIRFYTRLKTVTTRWYPRKTT